MKIVVLEHPRIVPKIRFNDIANTPLWSCLMAGYAASSLKDAGHEVYLIDAIEMGWDFHKTKEELLNISPMLVCINAVYFWENTEKLFDFLSELKTSGFSSHINLFGFFPTLAWEIILNRFISVDSIAVGECEDTLKKLADSLEKRCPLWKIEGLAYRHEGRICKNNPRAPEPFPDRFPFPLRSLKAGDTAAILASRGCYNQCSFCPIPVFYNNGPLWRGRTPENIIDEITELYNRGVSDYYFIDPNFIGPGRKGKERILKLAELIRPFNITYGMETRPNDLDKKTMEILAESGLKTLLLGIESGSLQILDGLNKGSSQNHGQRAISICRDVGIEPEIGFLMFVPDSSFSDLENNFKFLLNNRLLDRLDRTVNLLSHCQIVMYNTSGYRYFAKHKRLLQSDPLGFEYEISYRSEQVKWVKDIFVHTCRYILKNMADPVSFLYWRIPDNSPIKIKINNSLVDMFERLIKYAGKNKNLPGVESIQNDFEEELSGMLNS